MELEERLRLEQERHREEMVEARLEWSQERAEIHHAHQIEINGLEQTLVDSHAETERVRHELQTTQQRMAEQQREAKARIAELQGDIKEMTRKYSALQQRLDATQRELEVSRAKEIRLAQELIMVQEREERAVRQLKQDHATVTQALYSQIEEEKDRRRADLARLEAFQPHSNPIPTPFQPQVRLAHAPMLTPL